MAEANRWFLFAIHLHALQQVSRRPCNAEVSMSDISEEIRLLTVQEVDRLHPVSRTTRWRMVKRGEFPAPLQISPGRVAWKESDVRAWLETRK